MNISNRNSTTRDHRIRYALEEVALRVCRVHGPPVVDKDVEDREEDDEEGRRPLGLEADGNHDARSEADHGHEHTRDGPLALDDETNEQEDEEHTSRELEAGKRQACRVSNQVRTIGYLAT